MRSYQRGKGKTAFVLFLAAVLFTGTLAGCGGGTSDGAGTDGPEQEPVFGDGTAQTAMGRYTETELSLTENGQYRDFCQLLAGEGELYIPAYNSAGVRVGLEDFALKEEPDEELYPEALKTRSEEQDYLMDMAVADNNARMYTVFVSEGESGQESFYYDKYFLSADKTERLWADAVDKDTSVDFRYGGDGWFYVSDSWGKEDTRFYRVSAQSGETEYLCELEGSVIYFTICGNILFADMGDGIHMYDLEQKQEMEKDTVLCDFIGSDSRYSNGSMSFSYLLCSGKDDSIYVVSQKGLYRHVLYGGVMEQLIDGSLCSLGDISKMFIDMYVEESENGMPVFYLLYDTAELMRFAYDPDMPSVPDTVVTVYSLYECDNVRRVISGWQKKRPDVYVSYEVGLSGSDGVTKDDALKNLATRLAAGEGPDILILDDLPYASYKEKGVLADLGDVYEKLQAEHGYFDNIISALRDSGKLYCLPMSFVVPVLTGEAEDLKKIDSVESMIQAIRKKEVPAGTFKAGLRDEESVLQCLSFSMGQSLVREDGTLDREKLERFLELAKELYEADRENMSPEQLENQQLILQSFGSLDAQMRNRQGYYMSKKAGTLLQVNLSFGRKSGFTMGNLEGDIRYGFNDFYTLVQMQGHDYTVLPGEGKTCLPISMFGLSSASASPEAAKEFLQYALSDYLMETEHIDGISINRDALLKNEENPERDEAGNPSYEPYSYQAFSIQDGGRFEFEVAWCQPEVYESFNALLDGLDNVNLCDQMVIGTVLEEGVAAVNGSKSIEETADAIEKKMQLYLAE